MVRSLAPSRRRFLAASIVSGTTGLAGCSGWATEAPFGTGDATRPLADVPDAVGLEPVIDGLDAPLDVAFAPGADRRYVVERDGRVLVHEADGLREEPFLDLRDRIGTDGEKGLLGMALHPEFADNRRAFLRYSAPQRPGTPPNYSHTFVLAEVAATEDGRRAKPGSERAILEIPQPRELHNAGDLAFGPDGFLYVPVGDSGRSGNGQDVTETLLGSLLRIDVDSREAERAYAIPEDNPLVGREGRDEYYAWGFRNPWRLSFDDGNCFVADVGQSTFEEVNLVEKGGNYGWDVKEGTHCFREDDCSDETPADVRGGEPLLDPIVQYPHESEDEGTVVTGIAVIGGYVARSGTVPGLEGAYVFGDFIPEGRLFAAAPPDDPGATDDLWSTAALDLGDDAELATRLLAFARDPDGDVYAIGTGSSGGGLFRIVQADDANG